MKNESPWEWNGEGLPPVGTVCQGRLRNRLGEEDWFECAVLVHHRTLNHCAGVLSEDGMHLGWCSEFRPIRTAEQIAAEEREKVIIEMARAIMPGQVCAGVADMERAERLYDHGYRNNAEVLTALEDLAKAYRQAVGLDGAYDKALLKAESLLSK